MSTDVIISSSDSGSPQQGCPDNWGATFTNGVTTAYMSLHKSGVEETYYPRFEVTTSQPWALLIPQSYGSGYTVVAYDASSGGNVIGTSSSFSVTQSTLPSLPMAVTAKVVVLGDSTTQQAYALNTNPAYASAQPLNRYCNWAWRLEGYPANVQLWQAYHASGSGDGVRNGGSVEGVSSDAVLPYPVSAPDHPGYSTRIYRILQQRPQLVIITVSGNDVITSPFSTSTAIAAYQKLADECTRAGAYVLFAMMRPGGASGSPRVTINTGIDTICSTVTGCYFYDPSTIYTKAAGGLSSWSDPGATVDGDIIIGTHPTPRGGWLEAQVMITKMDSVNFFGTNNYALDVYNNASGETAVALQPNFNGGNNGSVSLSGGASGTFLIGITSAAGAGSGKSTMVGSVVANADTGGNSQRLTITPADTGIQNVRCITPNQNLTGYRGYIESMVEFEIVTDTENMVVSPSLQTDARATGGSYGAFIDGESVSAGIANTPPHTSGQKYYYYGLFYCDGAQTIVLQTWNFQLDATGRTADVVIDICRHQTRKLEQVNPHTVRYCPEGGTTERVSSNAGVITARCKYSATGIRPQGARFYTRLSSAIPAGWVYRGEAYSAPGEDGVSFSITGLTTDATYSVRAVPIRASNVLGDSSGKFYIDGTPSDVITAAASKVSSSNIFVSS